MKQYLYSEEIIRNNIRRTVAVRAAVLFVFWVLFFSLLQTLGGKSSSKEEVVISIVGDIMLSRGVSDYTEHYGYDYPYDDVREMFQVDDLSLANLECVISDDADTPYPGKTHVFRAAVQNAAALKKAGIDCVNLANNHTYDYMYKGLSDTVEALQENEIRYVGTYTGRNQPGSVYEINNIKIGILAYCMISPEELTDEKDDIRISYVTPDNIDIVRKDISSFDCDFCIIYFHWGDEYAKYPNEIQEKCARYAIDAGADFVVGTHPHVIQTKEIYKDGTIYYSLGNFIFDRQYYHGTDDSIILQLKIDKEGLIDINVIECLIKKSQVLRIRQ